MHVSIWRFRGDPNELLRSYDALLAEIPPQAMTLHACARTPDGIVMVDSCPTRANFESFSRGRFRELRRQHGLPDPVSVEHFPLHVGFVDGRRV